VSLKSKLVTFRPGWEWWLGSVERQKWIQVLGRRDGSPMLAICCAMAPGRFASDGLQPVWINFVTQPGEGVTRPTTRVQPSKLREGGSLHVMDHAQASIAPKEMAGPKSTDL
jgi:hypothetical protein